MTQDQMTPEVKRILKVIAIFKQLAQRRYYGKTTLSWEAGKIVNLIVRLKLLHTHLSLARIHTPRLSHLDRLLHEALDLLDDHATGFL